MPGLGDYETPSVGVCVHVSVGLSHFFINLYTSFIYEDIFKFAENVYGYKTYLNVNS